MTRSKFKHAVIDADWLISEDSHPVDREFVAVVDCNDGACSVTNDADNVVSHLKSIGALGNNRRIVYRDTEGVWDEICHFDGKFTGFKYVGTQTLQGPIT